MRDIAVTLIVFGLLPLCFMRTYVGILVWSWLSYMNPHRLTFNWAYDFPYAQFVAAATFAGVFINQDKKRIPNSGVTWLLVLFYIWMIITTFAATQQHLAWDQLTKVLKIQIVVWLTMAVMHTKERLIWLVAVIAGSIGFYGVKGGLYTVSKGGGGMVLGPAGSFIAGNTEIGLALVMTAPLGAFLYTQYKDNKWLKRIIAGSIALTLVAIIGSYSRGAFLAVFCMLGVWWIRSSGKVVMGSFIMLFLVGVIAFMPVEYINKMRSIQEYEEDGSAQGRINAWWMAFHMANDRFTGGGYESFQADNFYKYAPDPLDRHDAHSIYFEVLGEHGWVGLILFLLIALKSWRYASWVRSQIKGKEEWDWAYRLMNWIQISMIGYFAGGAFLGLAYFDFFYSMIAIILVVRMKVMDEMEQQKTKIQVGEWQQSRPRPPELSNSLR